MRSGSTTACPALPATPNATLKEHGGEGLFLSWVVNIMNQQEAVDKSAAPSTRMTYLGVSFDSVKFRKQIPPEKLAELSDLLGKWSTKTSCTKRGLQSLCGKLLWVAKCVKHSRVFLSRLLAALKTMCASLPYHKLTLDSEMRLDIPWWQLYMRSFNN